MSTPRQIVVELPLTHEGVQRAVDALSADLEALSAAELAYEPGTASDWVSPAPTTVQQALDRLAAAGGTTPVP